MFDPVNTKSRSEAVDILFTRAVPTLPVITMEDISRICENDLEYDLRHGQRHIRGGADEVRPTVVWNLDNVPQQLHSGQQVVGYQVMVQPQLLFAALTLFVSDASGTPGYAFGARVWRTADYLFIQGWDGFQASPLASLPAKTRGQGATENAHLLEAKTYNPSCGRCGKDLELEPLDPSDALQSRLPRTYLAAICDVCSKVECYRCRHAVVAPCSWCKGHCSPAYVTKFRRV